MFTMFTMFTMLTMLTMLILKISSAKVVKAMPGRDGPSSSAWPVGKAAASRHSAKREARDTLHESVWLRTNNCIYHYLSMLIMFS